MTDTADRLLQLWIKLEDLDGIPPTIREAQAALNISSASVVVYHLAKLCQEGKLIHYPNSSRAYRLPKEDGR